MDVVSLSPLRVGSLLWQPQRGSWALTVICKATYTLVPGESRLAVEQEYPNEDDNHWNDDPERSLYSPSDLMPFKRRADVMLVGHCFAPRGEAVRSLVTRLVVGTVDKSIEVWRERSWTADGQLRDGPRFTKMPLRWERAAGGPDTMNPVGVRPDARPDAYGARPVPNLQPTGVLLASPTDVVEPIGYGPIAASWSSRRDRLGRHAGTWSHTQWHRRELPDDVDPAYFNAAPQDQQLDELRDDERIVLENLHPEHARVVTNLPGTHPRAFVEKPGEAPRDLVLIADTLWIDTDRGLCTLTWRGQVSLDSPRLAGRVLVAMEAPGQRLGWDDVARMAGKNTVEGTETVDVDSFQMDKARKAQSLPFVAGEAGEPRPPPAPPLPKATEVETPPGDQSPSWLRPSPAVAPQLYEAQPAPARSPSVAPPPAAAAAAAFEPRSPHPIPPPIVESPWAAAARGGVGPDGERPELGTTRRDRAVGQPAAAVEPPVARAQTGSQLTSVPTVAPATPVAVSGKVASVGVVAASNAAAVAWPPAPVEAPVAPAPAPRAGRVTRDVVELLWFDPEAVARLREAPAFRDLCAEPPPKPRDDFDFDAEPPPEIPREVKDKKAVFAIMSRGGPIDGEGMNLAIAEAVGDDGTFVPPLVLVAGDLSFPFDDLETLKATVTAVTPLIAGDKKLKDTVDTVNELLQTPWLQSGTGVAEGLTARVKEAFAQGNRMLPASYLETHTDRILMEQRHYQRRTVFGEPHIRCLLTPTGNASSIPTYLPEALAKKLPMFQTLKGRVIAEAHVQQDQYETHPCALRVVALGRTILGPRR